MGVLKCKMCGGTIEFEQGATVGECEHCGTKQTLPKTDDDVIANLFNRANNMRLKCEFDKAMSIYEKIVEQDDGEAEAHWGIVLCRYGIEYVEDPTTKKRIPTCHRTLYEAVTTDPDYQAAIDYSDTLQQAIYEKEAKEIDKIQKNILAIVQKGEPFDVFICYKETDENGSRTKDSVIANDIYHQLIQEGFKVFYAAITLEDKLGQEYEPYIFAALTTAKVMLVIGSKPEYFNAVWVRNEWSRYLNLMKTDRTRLLIPCYKDMDAYELPEEFAHLQAQDMGKIGFINDVIRGIKKVVVNKDNIQTKKENETATTTNEGSNVEALLKRAFIFLEDGDWAKADEYCERVLDIDPENAEAYLGKLMSELQVQKRSELANCGIVYTNNKNYLKVVKYGDEKLQAEIEEYVKQNKYTSTKAFEFSKCEDGYSLTKLIDIKLESIYIPEKYLEKPVTTIGDFAFSGCENLTSVIIPESVTSIGDSAFSSCENLTSIVILGSVTSIGTSAFACCNNLTSITIPDSVTNIGDLAFYLCENLTSITIPDSVTNIGDLAFSECKNLTSITIPDSVTSIGACVFSSCKNLTSITIPDSVTSIGASAFSHCKNLESIIIPDSVISIGASAFSFCENLTNIAIPESVTNISDSAFYGCNKLADKNGFIVIRNIIHGYVGSETDIIIPEGVTSIGGWGFFNRENLTSITIANSVTSIGTSTFLFCENLASITIPDSVTSIGDSAFIGCSKLADKNGFIVIRNVIYGYVGSETDIIIPENVTSIGACAFEDCNNLTSVTIPDGMTSIGNLAFSYCYNLTSITIPDSVTSIGDWAFSECENLTSITIPDSVTNIGECAFLCCDNLTSITIPDSVTSIGASAFWGCDKLELILCNGDYNKLKTVLEINNFECANVKDSLERGERRKVEEKQETTKNSKVKKIVEAIKLNRITSNEQTLEDKLAASKARIESLTTLKNRFDTLLINMSQLQQEQAAITSQISNLSKELSSLVAQETSLTSRRSELGIFALREKKQIDEVLIQIDEKKKNINSYLFTLDDKKSDIDDRIRKNMEQCHGFNSKEEINQAIIKEIAVESEIESQIVNRQTNGETAYSYGEAIKNYLKFGMARAVNAVLYPTKDQNSIILGRYVQKDNGTSEPIEWEVLKRESNRILVISKYALDCQQYNTSNNTTWETCSLRKWLNNTFLTDAFSESEQSLILSVTVSDERNTQYVASSGNCTTDQIFLLNITEAREYFRYDQTRKCYGTPYCRSQGATIINDGICMWWLRSQGNGENCVAFVHVTGEVDTFGDVAISANIGVRPALWINIE